MTLQIGQMLSHYRLVEKIGEGGMGVVYRARDEHLERDVAIKVLPAGTLADEAVRRRFRKEALALSQLNHPNIGTVHDFDTQDGVDFLVLELVHGRTLSELIAAGLLDEREIARLGGQLAEGLEAAHRAGVVHRDIKPANVRITPEGRLKILDFGVARVVRPAGELSTTETAERGAIGTLPYMSPEQLRNEPVGARSDIYAAGAVLYEMASGRRAFPQETATAVIGAILGQPPPAPRALDPRVSVDLERIILRCLEKDPVHRYQRAGDLAADLRQLALPPRMRRIARPISSRPFRPAAMLTGTGAFVTVALLVALNVGGIRDRLFGRGPALDSLAVLPFENASGDPDAEYLGDGITESLIDNLTQLPQLTVMARSTVLKYKGQDPRKAGHDLAVRAVLTGSVMQRGDSLLIRAELVDASNGSRLWGQQYDRRVADIFAVEEDVAREIVDGLRLRPSAEEKSRLAKRHTQSKEAYQLYLKGRWHWNRWNAQDAQNAVKLFKEAIEADPSFALAYAGLADAYYWQSNQVLAPAEAMPRARAAAQKALELDADLAEAHVTLALTKFVYDWDWEGAEAAFRRGLRLNPGYAVGHAYYGYFLVSDVRPSEALSELHRALELDPLSVLTAWSATLPYYNAPPGKRQYDRAIEELQKLLKIEPDFVMATAVLGQVYSAAGRHKEAIEELQRALELCPVEEKGRCVAMLGYVYAAAGDKARAQSALADAIERRKKGEYVSSNYIAEVYAALGDRDQAFDWLEKAIETRDEELTVIKVNPRLDPLRSDPRFANLLRRMNLAP